MECLSSSIKRKKRKSRKCLDEIRKRSRRYNKISVSTSFDKIILKNNLQTTSKTNNRLTLCTIPKVIQSETITRPALTELKHYVNQVSLRSEIKVINSFNGNIQVSNLTNNVNYNGEWKYHSVKYNDQDESLNINSNIDTLTNLKKSAERNVIFNPLQFVVKMDKTLEKKEESNFSLQSHDYSGYNLYKEFISEIPKYLKQNTSAFIEEDIMNKTKLILQNLYIKNYNQVNDGNIFECMKSNSSKVLHTPSDTIVHDPMDYIRLGYVQHLNLFHNIGRSLSECARTPYSHIEQSFSAKSVAYTPSIVIHDTPEYTFYPHRLN